MICQCWDDKALERPTFTDIIASIELMNGGKNVNLVDKIIDKLEAHTKELESVVLRR